MTNLLEQAISCDDGDRAAQIIREYYQQAVDCARQADAQDDPKVKQQFLELKRLWLLLAQRCEFNKD